jgi:trehalose 2-sulfotransferase
VATPDAYLVCGTPRTGSTLLCSLLSSTGVLGHPESYFREPDEAAWARRFGLGTDGLRVHDYNTFVQAARAAGTSENGIFAVRVMWGSLERMIEGLGKSADQSDLVALERAFGNLAFLHLQREDVIGQAVSWCRAEQTGFWQHGDMVSRQPHLNVDQMKHLHGTICDHNAAWRSWFDRHRVQPHTVTYEGLVDDPRGTVAAVAAELGVELPPRWQPAPRHHKQADNTSAAWAAALHAALEN